MDAEDQTRWYNKSSIQLKSAWMSGDSVAARNKQSVNVISPPCDPPSSRSVTASLVADFEYAPEDADLIPVFIEENQFLAPLLKEIVDQIGKVFGARRLKLEYYVYYDEPHVKQLFVMIPCACSVEEALDKLDLFDKSWWYANLHRSKGKLGVDVEFIDE